MKILALVGSPRHDGNTAILVKKVLEGIKSKNRNAEIELMFLNDIKIKPCQSCYSCLSSPGECVQEDDMRLIYKSLAKTNILVIGTPIYMNYVSAQLKLFIDRLFPYVHEPRPPLQAGMKGVLVFTWGWDKVDGYNYVIKEIKEIISVICPKITEIIKGIGFRYKKVEALERPDLLKKAFETGAKLALKHQKTVK